MRSNSMFAVLVSIGVAIHQPGSAQTPAVADPGSARAANRLPKDRDSGLDLPALPKGTVSLIGGTVARVDPIRDQLVVRAFGGRDVTIDFDARTRVVREETTIPAREIHVGARIYADTILLNRRIFAKTIRVDAKPAVGEIRGQVTSYDPTNGILRVRDAVSRELFPLRVSSQTAIHRGDQPALASLLTDGTLVKIVLRASAERADTAQQIDILAHPGDLFTFAGKITFVDFRAGFIALADPRNADTHEVAVDSLSDAAKRELREGADVVIHAQFDGRKYEAQTIDPAPGQQR
jgi:hypothetical protein